MAPFRNLFLRRSVIGNIDRNHVSSTDSIGSAQNSMRSLSLNTRSSREESPPQYKMSVVNDSGVYLPPSPTEPVDSSRLSPTQNTTHNLVDENEPFSISRESFDSYRRSFDISAKSPVSRTNTTPSRASLDSRLAFARESPRTTFTSTSSLGPEPSMEEEEAFEDVGLNDDNKPTSKKRNFFFRFGDSQDNSPIQSGRPSSSVLSFHLPGRKRAQSGQGTELRPASQSISTLTESN